jgi:hypothetical protein
MSKIYFSTDIPTNSDGIDILLTIDTNHAIRAFDMMSENTQNTIQMSIFTKLSIGRIFIISFIIYPVLRLINQMQTEPFIEIPARERMRDGMMRDECWLILE